MNHKQQPCNFKMLIFSFSPRRKENKISESARVGPPSLLTYSEQRLGNLSPSEYCMKFQATYRACMEAECAAGDGLHLLQYLRISSLVCAHTHTAHGRWEEWLAVGTDLYFPSLLSILWDQLCHGNTGGGLLQCVTAGVGLYAHCGFIVLLDQDLYSPHIPSFQVLTWCIDIPLSTGTRSCTMPLEPLTRSCATGLGVPSKRSASTCLVLFFLKFRFFQRCKCN